MNANGPNLTCVTDFSREWSASDGLAVDRFIEAYEQARADDQHADYREFLPAGEHPLYLEVAAEMVRVDMEYSWNAPLDARSSGKTIGDYQRELPGLLSDRKALGQIAFEEYRLRALAGENVSADEYRRNYDVESDRWPPLTIGAQAMLAGGYGEQDQHSDSDRQWKDALTLAADVENFPEPGQDFAGFQIQREIGQGAFARVYVATQGELANRPVVLKIAAGNCVEALHLARLQHTNIVPIYSVHSSDQLTAACMPLLGTRTLADLIASVQGGSPGQPSRQNQISTFLQRRDDTFVVGTGSEETRPEETRPAKTGETPVPIVEALAQASDVDAVVWIVGQLAHGLQHAHQRGIVHRDLKPANILITDDGIPLVLDFNLSEGVVVHGPASVVVGGTLPYMSPEQLRAILTGGQLTPATDVFSLGAILYELLTGQRPFPDRHGRFEEVVAEALQDRALAITPVNRLNPAVPPSIGGVVGRCLHSDPEHRYGSMEQLSEDLRRHLENRPLQYARDRSIAERIRKWSRRHPRVSSAASVASLAGIVLLILASLLAARGQQVARGQAEDQLRRFNQEIPSLYMAVGMPPSETELLVDGVRQARASLDRYGVLDDKHWEARPSYQSLLPQQRAELEERLVLTLYLVANATAAIAEQGDDRQTTDDSIREALQLNAIARNILAPHESPRSLYDQQVRLLELAGDSVEAARVRGQAVAAAQDDDLLRYAEILSYHRKRDYLGAIPLLKKLRDLKPDDPAAWLFLGNAAAASGQLHESEGYFTAAVALGPNSYLSYFNRGLGRLQLGQFDEALHDFSQVITMQPRLACGYLNRALALRGLDRYQEAIDDLTEALARRAPQTRIYFLRSQLRTRVGDLQGAAEDFTAGLSATPADELSWVSRGMAQIKSDPQAALADFRRALLLNPSSRTALRNCVYVLADLLDRPEEAMQALNALLALDGEDPNALAGRAVLYARQQNRVAAITDVELLLQVSQEPKALFQAACVLSHTSAIEPEDAYKGLTLLTRAAAASPVWLARAQTDPDLQNLRRTDQYVAILQNFKELSKLNHERSDPLQN